MVVCAILHVSIQIGGIVWWASDVGLCFASDEKGSSEACVGKLFACAKGWVFTLAA